MLIKLLVKLGHWLETRFPEKRVVSVSDYENLHKRLKAIDAEVSMCRSSLSDTTLSLNKALERLSQVESAAVHKGAVRDLVIAVADLKTDYQGFKTSLGFRPNPELQAALNGEIINGD